MIARVQLELAPGLNLTLNDQLLFLIAFILLVIGFALAFAGRSVWKHVMSFIGAIVGGLLGFAFGSALSNSNILVGFIVGILGAFIGSAVFIFLARVGISALAGILAYLVVASLAGHIAGLVAGVIVFVATFIYAEVAIGVVTAVAGGLLAGYALMMLGVSSTLSVVAMLAIMVFGGTLQLTVLKEESDRKRMARTIARPSTVMSPPTPPPVAGRTCKKCGGPLEYIPEYNRYYCYPCQKYE